VLALISYKHEKHNSLKKIIDSKANTIPTTQRWTKIFKGLQITTRSKTPCNEKMSNGIVPMAITKKIQTIIKV
jgi:uncharacterized protein YhbP (UPF0306 family)